jgi:RNA polymerase sigma-70 factor (ECF subfamily)
LAASPPVLRISTCWWEAKTTASLTIKSNKLFGPVFSDMEKNFDSEIWNRFRRGEEKAFTYIFDTYHLQLFEYGQRFTTDTELIGDSIQDLYFELASKKDRLSSTDNILFYLLKSVRQKIFDSLKRNRIAEKHLDQFRLEYSVEADSFERELKLDRIAQALNQLPARQKETIYLKFYKNMSNAQVAEIMQTNYQSVGNNVQKAIHRLRSILNADSESIILFVRACFSGLSQ